MGYIHYMAALRELDLFRTFTTISIPPRMLSQNTARRQGLSVQHETIGWEYYMFYHMLSSTFYSTWLSGITTLNRPILSLG